MIVERDAGIASMPLRGAGVLVDGLVFSVPIAFVGAAIFGFRSTGFAIFGALALALYLIPQIAITGQTIGCRVVGLRIAVVSTLSPPGWARSIRRWAPQPLMLGLGRLLIPRGLVSLVVLLIIYLPALPDPRRRALHDRISGTVVRHIPRNTV
jgi:uncharacterized RDD family membrane protein YckC